MNLPGLSIRRPIAIIMIILSIVLIGSVSLSKLKIDLLPDLNMPIAVVTAKFEGAGPEEIERLVTVPLEEVLTTISDFKSIETVSTSEYSLCLVYFNDDTDMSFATLEMREKIDMVKPYLPQGVKDITVMRIDPNNFQSTVEIGISSEMEQEDLTRLVEDKIINRLERINGVAAARISGGVVQEVCIEMISERLALYGLNETSISQYIMSENINIPAGNIETAGMSIYLKTTGEFKSIEEISNLPIPTATGAIILLKDIANVSLIEKEKTSESYINGTPSLNLSVQKQSNANTVIVCTEIRNEIEKLSKLYPQIKLDIIYDSSTYINMAIKTVTESAIQGGILAVMILYLFLKDIRATLIIAVSMPASIIISFVLMYFSGISLNLISLAGFALGIGMLVDNSIVVLENIFRHRSEGRSLIDAAEYGTREVMLSITASTLTTVIVFVPIIYVEGMSGKIFKEMGLVITYSLMVSMIIAITLLPMMASKLLSRGFLRKKSHKKSSTMNLFYWWEKFYSNVCKGYEKLLISSLSRRGIVIALAAFLFVFSLISISTIGFEYFPLMDEGIITVKISLPKGSTLDATHDIAFKVQDRIKRVPEVREININIGNSGFVFDSSSSESATISVNIGSIKERSRTIVQIADDIRTNVKDIAGARINVIDDSKVMGFSIGYNKIDIRVSGDDTETLKKISAELLDILKNIDGIRYPESSLDEEIEEAVIVIDRSKALLYGLTPAQVGQAIRIGVTGIMATRYRYRGSDIDVIICTPDKNISTFNEINNITIQSPRGVSIPLSEVAQIKLEQSPPNIIRNDQKKTFSIKADLNGRALNKVTSDIDKAFSKYKFPSGYSYTYGGQQKEFIDSFDSLFNALVLSIIIVYMLLAAQFESLLHPFTILLTIPLALTGALILLLLTGKTLSVPAFIGIIILVGIVVDNAIVLIDSINRLRKEGLDKKEAIIKACPLRLRPILMTTLTTVLGMLPMAISRKEGSEIQIPLAIVVIGGLTVSTLVTLIVIPSLYMAFENMIDKVKEKRLLKKNLC